MIDPGLRGLGLVDKTPNQKQAQPSQPGSDLKKCSLFGLARPRAARYYVIAHDVKSKAVTSRQDTVKKGIAMKPDGSLSSRRIVRI